tara:strand:- start:2235 stop:3182 length:948 start_codon:yes stop_codon:yes gene_type:complete
MKIIFFGTTIFSVESLNNLIENKYEVLSVVCPVDKVSNRGLKTKFCEVKQYAIKKNINIIQYNDLNSKELIKILKKINADLYVVVAFKKIPKEIWSIPKYGTFNIHASILPDYRGAAPINWSIINGENKTGVTSFFINDKIDSGDIIMSKSCEINIYDNFQTLHDKLMKIGAKLTIETCKKLKKGNLKLIRQNLNKNFKLAPKLNKKKCQLNFKKQIEEIHNFIRGLSPYPCAWFRIKIKNKIKIMKVFNSSYRIKINEQKNLKPYIEINKHEFKIILRDGIIFLNEVQIENKNRMNIKNFINGINSKVEIIDYY